MKAIAIAIVIIIAVIIPLLLFIADVLKFRTPGDDEDTTELLSEAYESAFRLQRHLASSDDETCRRASTKLNKVVDTLLEVERIIQKED